MIAMIRELLDKGIGRTDNHHIINRNDKAFAKVGNVKSECFFQNRMAEILISV